VPYDGGVAETERLPRGPLEELMDGTKTEPVPRGMLLEMTGREEELMGREEPPAPQV